MGVMLFERKNPHDVITTILEMNQTGVFIHTEISTIMRNEKIRKEFILFELRSRSSNSSERLAINIAQIRL